jgi:glycosyltransferase involved in cell wall biosynthesis
MWQLYGRRHGYAVVENGVGDEFFDSVEPYPFRKPTVLYVGSFDHAPNRYAVSWILQQILPRVSKAIPDVQFAFVGSTHWASPPELTGALVFTNVQDVRPYIRGASVALSTVLHGSGTRLKTLEYLACGTPVVSTAKGVEGLALQDQTDLLVADGHEQVARMVIEALRSLDRAKEMAAHGRDVVRERYTWKSIVARSLQAYNRLLR